MYDKELKQSIDALRAVIILATKAMQEVVTEVKKKQNEFPKFAITSGWNPETDIEHKIKKWCDAINKLGNNNNDKPEPNDPLSGMYVDEKKYPDYVCIKDYSDSKKGDIFKYQFVNKHLKYAYENCTNKKTFCYSPEYFKNDPEHFVTDEQWNILNGYIQKDGTVFVSENSEVDQDKIEFHDKDGFAWFVITKSNKFWQDFAKKKAEEIKPFEIKKNADGSYYFEIEFKKKETPLTDLPKVVIAETKTCDENIIIQHTKLDEKFYKDQGLEFKCEELINHFMPLVTKWKFEGNTIVNQEETYSGVWSYSDNNKRKAAIKIAILHCELNMVLPLTTKHFETIKNKLEKMLSE